MCILAHYTLMFVIGKCVNDHQERARRKENLCV